MKAGPSLEDRLRHFLQAAGDARHLEGGVVAIAEGHAGRTFSFALASAESKADQFVLKLGPEGVARSGSTDIYRQVPLLQALRASGFPVPAIPWASAGTEWLGAPFIIMERLSGRHFFIWQPAADLDRSTMPSLWLQSAALLGRFHSLAMGDVLAGWEAPTGLARELDRWERLIRHSSDLNDRDAATRLAQELRRSLPPDGSIGVVHGDFQPGNILFDGDRAEALIDWDLAAIGPLGMDVGWLLMMADDEAWAADWQPIGAPAADALLAAYVESGGPAPHAVAWQRAFACFRMAVITGLNLKLHRDGRRPDAMWEKFAPSAATLCARGLDLLGAPA